MTDQQNTHYETHERLLKTLQRLERKRFRFPVGSPVRRKLSEAMTRLAYAISDHGETFPLLCEDDLECVK